MSKLVGRKPIELNINELKDGYIPVYDLERGLWTTVSPSEAVTASLAITASYVEYEDIANKPALVSSSTQVIDHINGNTITPLSVLATSFTGSFTGSFYGNGSNLNFTTLNTNQTTDSELVVGNIYNNYQYRQKTIFRSGDLEVSGSVTITNEGFLILNPRTAPIPAVGGGIFYSSSGEFFVGTPL